MRTAFLGVAFLMLATAAQAQPAPFVPYQISEQEHQAILNALGPLPYAQAAPLVQFFLQAEQKAVLAEDAKKKAGAAADKPVPPRPGP